MASSPYMIGVDIGTTSTKAVLFEQNGTIVAQGSADYPLHTPTPAIAEQDAEDIFKAVITSVNRLPPKRELSQKTFCLYRLVRPCTAFCLSINTAHH